MSQTRVRNLSIVLQGILLSVAAVMAAPSAANGFFGGLKKWIKNEVVPTLEGKRPLKIDPNRVTITHEGKKILEVSGNTAQIHVGPVSVKTGNLRKTLAQIGAIYAGDTAVLGAMAQEETQRHLSKMMKKNLIRKTGENRYEAVNIERPHQRAVSTRRPVRTVTIYNLTGARVSYAMNDELFFVEDDNGHQHSAPEHYLQLDTDAGEGIAIGRWSLDNARQYILTLAPNKRSLVLCRLTDDETRLSCFDRAGPVDVPPIQAGVEAT